MTKPRLKYSFLNEDPNCELKVMPAGVETIVCVAGSGFRVLPLLSHPSLKKIYIVDHSKAQLDNTRKILALFDEPDYECFIQQINPTSAQSQIYSGQHEHSYFLRARLLRLFFLGQLNPKIDLTQSLRWPLFTKIYARFLRTIRKESSPSQNYANYLTTSLKKLMSTPYDQNFFWQQFLYGYAKTLDSFTTLIPEATWVSAKNSIGRIDIQYIESDIIDFLETKIDEIDFISFSNIINYLSDTRKTVLEKALEKSLKIKGQILLRSYLDPINLKSDCLIEDRSKMDVLETEMTGSYLMKVYEKI